MDPDPNDKVVNIQVELTPEAKLVVDELKDATGIAKKQAVSRILRWFASLDAGTRDRVIRGESIDRIAQARIAELEAKGQKITGMTPEQAAAMARLAIERLEMLSVEYRRHLVPDPKKNKS